MIQFDLISIKANSVIWDKILWATENYKLLKLICIQHTSFRVQTSYMHNNLS